MSETQSGLLTVLLVVAVLAAAYLPLGAWLARVYGDGRHWRVERWVYRLVRVDPDGTQGWRAYATSVVALSVVSVVALTGLALAQSRLPLSQGAAMGPTTAVNTAVSFVTNTNWQSYAGEVGAGPLLDTAGLTVQNFLSAAVGMAVAAALIRGLAAQTSTRLGNFWVDLVRGTVRVLLPLAVVAAVLLVAGGVIQNLTAPQTVSSVAGAPQTVHGGLIASQEAIKLLGTNGGGYLNANSAHPFENPGPGTNVLEVVLILVIPVALTRTYGILMGSRRQGWALLGVATVLWTAGVAAVTAAELAGAGGIQGAMEGKEVRFGVWGSALFAASTTGTSTGAVNSMHSSYTPLGGGAALFSMMLGEVSPGGVGSGLYGLLVASILAVFLAGLMVGRTPEFLGKSVGRGEITCAALYALVTPALALAGTALALALPQPRESLSTTGPHGLTEVLYAYTSAANNNGSAFAGLAADTPWFDLTLALVMAVGRLVPMLIVLRLAGLLAEQRRRPVTAGTMPTHGPLFVVLTTGVVLVVAGLTYVPALALGPLAEGLR
jgi:K+-transporting ATPase ATPase A chain